MQLYQQGRLPEALAQFQDATYADPNGADGYYNLAATYHRLGVIQNQPGDLAKAETCYYQCLDHDPNHRDCYRGLCVLLAGQGRSDDAFRLLQRWNDQQPSSAEPKIELARLYDELGNKSAAKERLIEALALDSGNSRAWAALGKLREETGEQALALDNYARSLQTNQSQPELAARITALRSMMPTNPTTADPNGPTRTVNVPTPVMR